MRKKKIPDRMVKVEMSLYKEATTKIICRNLVLSMLCNVTPPVGVLFFKVQIYIALVENLKNQVTLEYGPGLTLILLT